MKTPNTTRHILTAVALLFLQLTECYCKKSRRRRELTAEELWDFYECEDIFEEQRPVHTPSEWLEIRDAYQMAVGIERSSLLVSSGHGFNVDVEVKQVEGKGRGVFAVGPIKKGQLIWSTTMTARFDHGEDYRRFLSFIREDLACDVLQWAYVQTLESKLTKTTKAFISADLDEGSFINSVGAPDEDNDGEEANIGCVPEVAEEHPGGCKQHYFALRDIKDGEELILDYSDFAIQEGWQWFGL